MSDNATGWADQCCGINTNFSFGIDSYKKNIYTVANLDTNRNLEMAIG